MKLHFLGTGAADWDWSQREVGRNYRRSTATLFDGTLLMDCGPCIPFMEKEYETILFDSVTDVLVTHSHGDHFSVDSLRFLASKSEIALHGDPVLGPLVAGLDNVVFTPIAIGETQSFGGFTVTALAANHLTERKEEHPRHYLLEKNGKKVYYGLDGAWLLKQAFLELNRQKPIDGYIADATVGQESGAPILFEHNNLMMVSQMKVSLERCGILTLASKFVLDHMAKYHHAGHEKLSDWAQEHGMIAAYDNFLLEV